jgi:ectoine hydroxylase-related dioxygenase (phytanoyl-CoA dioxygenase family)
MLAQQASVRSAAVAVLGSNCFPVRALLFDKTPSANWKVAWHQDLTIAVGARRDVDGYGPWSSKGGVPHVQPPIAILERMLAIRVHLDDCGPDNGPVRVLPGSHRARRLSVAEIDAWRRRVAEVSCIVPPGGLLVMRPLLLHASSAAKSPAHRRVIHIEYAATGLPEGLEWYEAWGLR